MSTNYLTVQALTKYIKRKFEADPHLRDVYVKGELSNVKVHNSGHIFFTLKDDRAQIQAIMYASSASTLPFKPESGMKVLLRGDTNVYESAGRYQLYVKDMQPDGLGSLHLAFEQLKKELQTRGLFKEEFKQPIIKYPRCIGVVTAQTGAAIRDILATLQSHYPLAKVIIFPALVQGKNAAASIVQAIHQANDHGEVDTLIVGRGGGSIEDLWAFNEELVAEAIFESRVPIISGVGHETDTTIADFVADMRAPTPTAAAKMAVPDQTDLMQKILSMQARIHQNTQALVKHERARLNRIRQAYPMVYPERLYRPFIDELLRLDDRLIRATNDVLQKNRSHLQQLANRLQNQCPLKEIQYELKIVERHNNALHHAMQQLLQQQKNRFVSTIRTLEALNPLAIMSRGYAIAYDDQEVIKTVDSMMVGQTLRLHFHDGQANVAVQSIDKAQEE
ncbi:exodeoxyribonuclease VII large subunit [Kurthia sibirica]|uniref:Exodeoxyribonuclease 7 large subunit n=1 Tax=Kurthia sibirica TaxID=202750 RepID=A0A2U3ALU8_9BACL|nr:exodeoxyribonuclease VII large subunit [Kurthia sibirica]PWI25506.1 exodeoxyribonuclease VII large subunit [Kurthia sibirica]GEK33983.1 exodeoxyribonuclease 7 large subunit [Kurthia sibirica]